MPVDASYWDDLIAGAVRGKKWIAAQEYLGGLDLLVERLHRQGADGVFCLVANRGLGTEPDPEKASWHVLDLDVAGSIMDGIRAYEGALEDLPDAARAAVDAFDPDGNAVVLRTIFAIDGPVAGRRSYGARPAKWLELEDKTRVDELWDAAGVERAPSRVVDATRDALLSAHDDLASDLGSVWVADNSEGWHGGAQYARWVRTEADIEGAVDFIEAHATKARVMPFLDGIPCSIHGFVFPDDVAVFRPVELLIFRRPDSPELFYAGTSTQWDPSPEDRDYMRSVARRVGEHVRESHGYRSAFNLDGILTAGGWLPTEFNARFSAGLGAVQRGFETSLYHLHLMVVEGEGVDFRPRELEEVVTAAADANRLAAAGAPLATPRSEALTAGIRFDQGKAHLVDEDDDRAQGTVGWGPSSAGSYVRVRVAEDHVEQGASMAPRAAAVFAALDEEWGTDIGPVEPAPDLRR